MATSPKFSLIPSSCIHAHIVLHTYQGIQGIHHDTYTISVYYIESIYTLYSIRVHTINSIHILYGTGTLLCMFICTSKFLGCISLVFQRPFVYHPSNRQQGLDLKVLLKSYIRFILLKLFSHNFQQILQIKILAYEKKNGLMCN